MMDNERRIEMTAGCRDADAIPKVRNAGRVRTTADGTRVQTMHNGLKVVADGYCGEWMTDLISRCRGHHEPQEEKVFDALLRALSGDATMIELGGWWSYYSLWFLMRQPARRAVILEPEPRHLEVGRTNAALNGLSPMFVSGFVSDSADLTPQQFASGPSGALALPRYSVPQLMDDCQIGYLDLLHCDVDGAELRVLAGCEPLFREKRVGWVMVSTHAHQICGDPIMHQKCLSLLRDFGATIEVEHDVHESFSGDGLIAARFVDKPAAWSPPRISYNRYSTSLFPNPLFELAGFLGSA